jgi:hypothetical protein
LFLERTQLIALLCLRQHRELALIAFN